MIPDLRHTERFQIILGLLGALLLIILLLHLFVRAAAASPECMTKEEARAKFPNSHIWYHGLARCWDDQPGRVHRTPKKMKFDDPGTLGKKNVLKLPPPARDANGNVGHHSGAPVEPQFNEIDAQADKSPAISFPDLLPGIGTNSEMLTPMVMTAWPALIDVDLNPGFDPWQSRIEGAFQK